MKYPKFAVLSRPFLAALLVVGTGVVGVASNHFSSAATYTNFDAVGSIDSCTLSGSTTTIYGWANDPDTTTDEYPHATITIGGTTVTAKTDITYRTSAINSYISGRFPNQPFNPPYGYKVTFTNLYKGTTYHVTGTALNRGANGSNTALMYNNPKDTTAGKAFFTGSTLPSACQPAAPVQPPPPSGGGGSGGGSGGSSGGGSSSGGTHSTGGGSAAPAAAAEPTADADTTVKTGTVSAILNLPAGNAATIHIDYNAAGEEAVSSPDQAVTGDAATLEIDNLQAKTDYAYQIVRTNSAGTVAMSPVAGFTTTGYTVSLHFVDANKQPVSGIAGNIDKDTNTETKSDKDGHLTFKDLDEGTHTVTYTYAGKEHSAQFDTTTALVAADPAATIELSSTVDVSKLVAAHIQKSGGSGGVVWTILALMMLAAGAFFGWRWWRRRQVMRGITTPAVDTSDILDRHSLEHFAKHQPAPQPLPEHAGKSLRDMVVESMHGQGPALAQQPTPPSPSVSPTAPLPPPPRAPQPPTHSAVPPAPETHHSAKPDHPAPHKKSGSDNTELKIKH